MWFNATCEYLSCFSSSTVCASVAASFGRKTERGVAGGSGVAATDDEAGGCCLPFFLLDWDCDAEEEEDEPAPGCCGHGILKS